MSETNTFFTLTHTYVELYIDTVGRKTLIYIGNSMMSTVCYLDEIHTLDG